MQNRARINTLIRDRMIYRSRRLSPLAESNPGMDRKSSRSLLAACNGLRLHDLMYAKYFLTLKMHFINFNMSCLDNRCIIIFLNKKIDNIID